MISSTNMQIYDLMNKLETILNNILCYVRGELGMNIIIKSDQVTSQVD